MTNVEKGIVVVVALAVAALIAAALMSRGDSESPTSEPAGDCEEGVVETESGLRYEDLECGEGAVAEAGAQVKVHYTLTLSDGSTADSSRGGDPLDVRLGAGQVIPGFEEGLTGMRVGGQRRLIVPPELGYGAQGSGSIPPNETLTFDVELVEVAAE